MNREAIEKLEMLLPAAEYIGKLHERKKGVQQAIVDCDNQLNSRKKFADQLKFFFTIAACVCAVGIIACILEKSLFAFLFAGVGALCIFIASVSGGGLDGVKRESDEKTLLYAKELTDIDCELEQRIQQLSALDVFSFIPPDYFYMDAIQFFITVLRKTLARDLHEAILLYENELSRIRNEQLQMELTAQQIHSQQKLAEAMEMRTLMLWMLNDRK